MLSDPIDVTFMKCNIVLIEMESWLVVAGVQEGAGVGGVQGNMGILVLRGISVS